MRPALSNSGRPTTWQEKEGHSLHTHIQLLVEVAVEQAPVPTHIDSVSAHHAVCSGDIETLHQQLQAPQSKSRIHFLCVQQYVLLCGWYSKHF